MRQAWLLIILVSFFGGCRQEYLPELRPSDTQVLIVEGFIKAGAGQTVIRLSKSRPITSTDPLMGIDGATVVIEGDDQATFLLTNRDNGFYESAGTLPLDPAKKYRLRFTIGDKQYASSFEKVLMTPDIDSVSWQRDGTGVEINVNTHSNDEELIYYLWDWTETWQYHSKFESFYKWDTGATIVARPDRERQDMYTCWKHVTSSNILVGSSARLESNVIYRYPLRQIPQPDQRLSVRYSIIVNQYSLSRGAYDFYQLIKRNTETTGSIFGPQPSEVSGNVRNLSDPTELVVGYVGVAMARQKRIFITNSELPGWNYIPPCEEVYVVNNPDTLRLYLGAYIPYQMKGFFEGFYLANETCIDCTLTGTNRRPDFW